MSVVLHQGDCLEVMRTLEDCSIDAVITDPPYGLEFMGKDWDGADGFRRSLNAADAGRDSVFGRTSRKSPEYRAGHLFQEWCQAWASECLRVLKPGGHLLAFGGTRTCHRLVCAIEDAGFEVRDTIMWIYGQGFPKSHDVGKAIDRTAGEVREVVGQKTFADGTKARITQKLGGNATFSDPVSRESNLYITAPATEAAKRWEGWGTALKPAHEPICVARKPPIGTVAQNVQEWETGAINVDACRVESGDDHVANCNRANVKSHWGNSNGSIFVEASPLGRWPANVIHDGSDDVLRLFPDSKGQCGSVHGDEPSNPALTVYGAYNGRPPFEKRGDCGSAARFFYCAKASKKERGESKHPTVKPVELMKWLCRLVTPPGGTILDPFAGSGTTGLAADSQGFNAILIEREEDYCDDIRRRLGEEAQTEEPETETHVLSDIFEACH